MKQKTKYEGCALTLFTPDRREIIAELSDARWIEQSRDAGITHVFSGHASDGTMDELRRQVAGGVESVAFDFEIPGKVFQGFAMIARPLETGMPGMTELGIETHEAPRVVPTRSHIHA